jgi:hypothetical protein
LPGRIPVGDAVVAHIHRGHRPFSAFVTGSSASSRAGRRTQLIYIVREFKGPAPLFTPLLRPAFERLGKQAQNGMRTALNQL